MAGRTFTEAKLSDDVLVMIRRQRDLAGVLRLTLGARFETVTIDGERIKTYAFDDLLERLPAARRAAFENAINDLIEDIATRLGVTPL